MHWKMNTYCPLIKFTFAKKLMDRDSPKRTTYSSPTLKFLFKKLTYFIQPKQDQFWLSSPMGWVPLPRSFPISWYCKLDTGMQEPNLHPELQMQQTVASGLAAQTCQFDRPCTNLAWCSFPGEPLCQRIHLISPPQEFTRQQPKK